uniref:Uncharacterized protein n=1 Tax=uncultured Alphaproteobacteria bacterium TaxID=91750 RepID=A0A6G8F272_9PROT|nr:hypothetical protein PlAlph_1110 [uncultured Alphaproteobacteria bacterium]
MKNISIYVLGIITGIVLSLISEVISDNKENDTSYNIKGLTLQKDRGNCLDYKMLEVFQVLDNQSTLVYALSKEHKEMLDSIDEEGPLMGQIMKNALTNLGYSDGLPVLLINPEGKLFYDEEKIEISTEKCLRQIGTYSYTTTEDIQKTVPAVIIE